MAQQRRVPPIRRAAFVVVLALAVISVLLTVAVDFRLGGYLLGFALAVAAGARATLPDRYCLGLLVRSRRVDVLTSAVLAIAVVIGAQIVPG